MAEKKSKKAAAKPAEGSEDNRLMIIAAAVAAVGVAALVVFVALSAAPGQPGPEPEAGSVEPEETGTPLSKLMPGTAEALQAVERGKVSVLMEMGMSLTVMETAQDVSMSSGTRVDFDKAAERLYMKADATESSPPQEPLEQSMEMYVIGNMTYSSIVDPSTGDEYWIKEETLEDPWAMIDPAGAADLLEMLEGEVVGTESVGGEAARKIKIEPDMEALMGALMGAQAGDLAMMGVTEEDIDETVGIFEDSLEEFEAYIWVSEETSLPLKAEGSMRLAMDMTQQGGGAMTMDIGMAIEADFESPVDVQLPEEAKAAMTLEELYEELYEPVCGDYICDPDAGEDSETCPVDCGQAVNQTLNLTI